MKRSKGLAAVFAVAALAGGGAVAAASVGGSGSGDTTTGTTATGGTGTTPTQRPHAGAFGFGFGLGGGLDFFDAATKTALTETFAAVESARKSATDAGKSPDEIRDAAIAAAKTRPRPGRLGRCADEGAGRRGAWRR